MLGHNQIIWEFKLSHIVVTRNGRVPIDVTRGWSARVEMIMYSSSSLSAGVSGRTTLFQSPGFQVNMPGLRKPTPPLSLAPHAEEELRPLQERADAPRRTLLN